MAITSSAKKAIRGAQRKRLFNIRRERKIAAVVKDINKLVAAKKIDEAKKLVPAAYQAIDKAVKTNYLKANTGARMKSRLVKMLNKQAA